LNLSCFSFLTVLGRVLGAMKPFPCYSELVNDWLALQCHGASSRRSGCCGRPANTRPGPSACRNCVCPSRPFPVRCVLCVQLAATCTTRLTWDALAAACRRWLRSVRTDPAPCTCPLPLQELACKWRPGMDGQHKIGWRAHEPLPVLRRGNRPMHHAVVDSPARHALVNCTHACGKVSSSMGDRRFGRCLSGLGPAWQ
jgi:hypothetical protein